MAFQKLWVLSFNHLIVIQFFAYFLCIIDTFHSDDRAIFVSDFEHIANVIYFTFNLLATLSGYDILRSIRRKLPEHDSNPVEIFQLSAIKAIRDLNLDLVVISEFYFASIEVLDLILDKLCFKI